MPFPWAKLLSYMLGTQQCLNSSTAAQGGPLTVLWDMDKQGTRAQMQQHQHHLGQGESNLLECRSIQEGLAGPGEMVEANCWGNLRNNREESGVSSQAPF